MGDNPIYSDFWLSEDTYSTYMHPRQDSNGGFSINLIQLASVRRVISNYVDILTGASVPVYFKAAGDSYNVGGKEIYITTEIRRRKDFDQAVGLALHEAAHTLLTDFDLMRAIPFKAPKSIWEFGRKYKIATTSLERFLRTMFNIVEDWYIDDWVITNAPGYTGYYEASYNVCFNTPIIDELLLSNEYRYPSLESYRFRIINFCNPLTDLNALPGLAEIAKELDIANISRLVTTKDRVRVAYRVVQIVLENLQNAQDSMKSSPNQNGDGKGKNQKDARVDVDKFFKPEKNSPDTGSVSPKGVEKSDTDRMVGDIGDALANRPKQDDEDKSMVSQVSKSPNKELSKSISEAVRAQMEYVNGDTEKKELGSEQKTVLDLIEKHGICLVYVPVTLQGNDAAVRVGCIVVKKLTMELIESGTEVFPMAKFWKDMDGNIQPEAAIAEAVSNGISLGTKLGRRLVIRREVNQNREIRKRSGKINRRLLYSAGFESDDIFEKIKILKYSQGSLHITVDASTSMIGKKWTDTMTMCVAICKAASMVENIHVTVSFRATHHSAGGEMPYVVLAYDSKKDKFSKIKNLFRFLSPCGCTPEGLAFGAIMDVFTGSSPDDEDRYFLNISDGEPFFSMRTGVAGKNFHYGDGGGVEHTRQQVNKIRNQGISILSYYVEDGRSDSFITQEKSARKNFHIMYGKDARFIQSDSVMELAKTINELFIKGR